MEMKHPMRRLARINMVLPHSKPLEHSLVPQVDDIVKTVKDMV
jgi:pyruvate/2-oxoglutarate/acetoin dehydrogenase E1 component